MGKYDHVFQPLKIGKLTARNRIEVSPAEPFLATKEGLVTEEFVKFTASFARGGAGIVTVGDSPVTQEYANNNRYVINLADPFVVHGLVKVSDAIHRYGALASIELNLREEYDLAKLTHEEIKGIQTSFADAAERCRKGGFDMVMVHCGHGHVVANFFSPQHNTRTDEYGISTMENRCRFASELLAMVRERIGDKMAIEIRMSGDELTEGGVGVEDAVQIAKYLEPQVDMVHVSAGNLYNFATIPYMIQSTYVPMATNVRFAERFKKELNIPVVTVGSFTMDLAEEALAKGQADMVAMIRSFIADPDMVNKAKEGRGDEIRPCIRCCNCTGGDPHGCPVPLRCSVNAVAGREMDFDSIVVTDDPKKVVIVGGGCAGLEAARRLAERGHFPIILEKSDRLGGNLWPAGDNPLKFNVKAYRDWSIRSVENDPFIEVHLNTPATPKLIKEFNPDALIIAAGAKAIVPNVPGIQEESVVFAEDVDMGKATCGHNVIIVGAGMTGSETAVALAQRGHSVTQIDMLTLREIDMRGNTSMSNVGTLRGMAMKEGIKILEQTKLKAVEEGRIVCEGADGQELILPCDTLVLSVGLQSRTNVVEELSGLVDETYVVGDCVSVGNITSAVREAFFAAQNI